uniref:Putative secreted protein n=1 Tax=Anopheles darlingi TaxID=43151 RepID=A0A2M4D146_ANODA
MPTESVAFVPSSLLLLLVLLERVMPRRLVRMVVVVVMMGTTCHYFMQRIAANGRGCQLRRQHTGGFTIRILLQERTLYRWSGPRMGAFICSRPTVTAGC